jgi:hypothetical protein
VQGPFDPKRNVPLIDLGTVRDMLSYIRDDFSECRHQSKIVSDRSISLRSWNVNLALKSMM